MTHADQNMGPGVLGYVMLLDPTTGKPYKAQNTVQQVEGEFNTTGIATETKQDDQIEALHQVSHKLDQPLAVDVLNAEMPLPTGAASSNKQDQIIAALQSLGTQLGLPLTVSVNNGSIAITVDDLPLPEGAATADKQDAALTLLAAIRDIFQADTLAVAGEVSLDPADITALKTVTIDNPSIAVTASSPLSVTLPGVSTADKQDAILTRLQTLIDNSLLPRPITDNGGSITVDGAVSVSGPIQVEDNGGSLTVDGTVGATQSGSWNVGITGTPTVNVGNTVTISDGSGPVTVDGTVGVSGTVASTQSGTWNVGITGTPTVNATPTGAATLSTTPTAVNVGTTSVQIIAAQTSRRSVIIQNMGTTVLYLSFAATATVTTPTFQVQANGWITIDRETWTGQISGIRPSGAATAAAVVTVTA